jgi:hypothetical protein
MNHLASDVEILSVLVIGAFPEGYTPLFTDVWLRGLPNGICCSKDPRGR